MARGPNLVTTFQSATSIQAVVPAALLATPGTASVVVASSSTLVSSPQTFTINAPAVPAGLALAIPTPGVLPTGPAVDHGDAEFARARRLHRNASVEFRSGQWGCRMACEPNQFPGGFRGRHKLDELYDRPGVYHGHRPNNGVFQQGTVAGTITAVVTTVNGAPLPAGSQPSVTQAVKAMAPVITSGLGAYHECYLHRVYGAAHRVFHDTRSDERDVHVPGGQWRHAQRGDTDRESGLCGDYMVLQRSRASGGRQFQLIRAILLQRKSQRTGRRFRHADEFRRDVVGGERAP